MSALFAFGQDEQGKGLLAMRGHVASIGRPGSGHQPTAISQQPSGNGHQPPANDHQLLAELVS
jgi:hypothetical protein